ncbi:MAG: phosphoenolpyruvate--protein phosphotransferase [Clostridia bacterium]|nr:phosphoenolpyruvate--protein phosphotransferase [Clostridia bacterium]
MITLSGKPVCGGIVFGKIYIYSRKESIIVRSHVSSSDTEIQRFENARLQAYNELGELYERAVEEVGKANAMIFQIHQMMLEDPDYIESIKNIITDELLNAETAVGQTCDNFVQMFKAMEDEYMRERSADIRDVSERIIRILGGKSRSGIDTDEPVIIVSDDLSPSETVQFDKDKILAFVTEGGSDNSHTSILARTMNIPAIINVKNIVSDEYNGLNAVIDGFSGTVYINPDKKTTLKLRQLQKNSEENIKNLEQLKGVPNITKDGQKIELCANIGNILDIPAVISNDADGIGLFRSEFIYLENTAYPTEEQQFEAYKYLLSQMPDKRIIIRTLDIGADKQAAYFNMPKEENPAMGIRAIRICLRRPEIFKTQLRALFRASVFGRLAIMFPMISSEWEIIKILNIVDEVKTELKSENIPYSETVELGCMIETPAAAIISDILARYVDFFSIGTNDLTQYTLAADRQNPDIGEFFDIHHKSLLRLIKLVADNAHANGIRVGICGELAADTSLTDFFLSADIDELSVTPNAILPLRQKIINTDVSKVKESILSDILN